MARNRLCDLLSIRYPIVQAPMNWVSGAELAAAVSNAGGLGTLGPNAGARTIVKDVGLVGERLRSQIRKVKSLTGKPFAVNVAIGKGEIRQYSQRYFEILVEEQVPVCVVSVGSPDVYTDSLKGAGVKVLHAISTVRHARKAEEAGVDAVVCEGFEGGGHKGFAELTTMVLLPLVADAVKVPIVAGGGIADARGVIAALALGADGVYMGTRFMATRESNSHTTVKEAIARAQDVCTISVPKAIMLGRDLKNRFTEKYMQMKEAGASRDELQAYLNKHSQWHAQVQGDVEGSEVCCGQVAALTGSVVSAAEVIRDIVNGMPVVQHKLGGKLSCFS